MWRALINSDGIKLPPWQLYHLTFSLSFSLLSPLDFFLLGNFPPFSCAPGVPSDPHCSRARIQKGVKFEKLRSGNEKFWSRFQESRSFPVFSKGLWNGASWHHLFSPYDDHPSSAYFSIIPPQIPQICGSIYPSQSSHKYRGFSLHSPSSELLLQFPLFFSPFFLFLFLLHHHLAFLLIPPKKPLPNLSGKVLKAPKLGE